MTKGLPKGIRQRTDGRYEGRFTYKGESYTFYNMDLRKLQKELADKRYEVEHGLYAKETNMTVGAWFDTWMKEYKKDNVKYGTYKLYQDEYARHIRDVFGKKKLADIRSHHIQKLFNQMAKKYSRKTICIVKIILSGMFKQAYKNEIIQKNPVENTSLPKGKAPKEFRVMTIEEQKLFLEYAKDSIYYEVYVVALGTGMRNGELRALQWSDIDFNNREIHVNHTLKYIAKGEEKYRLDTPKTASSKRTIPMLDNVYEVLKKQKRQQLEKRLQLGDKWKPQKGFENLVFTGAYGRCITDSAIYYDMIKIENKIMAAGVEFEHIYPHTLRHTFATRGLENGIPPKVMQELLGHTSITMTMDIYSHVLPDTKASEIQKIANLF